MRAAVRRGAAVWVFVGVACVSARVIGQRGTAPASDPLGALLQRAVTTDPGTYALSDGADLQPAATSLPVQLQADVVRGPDRTARVAVVVGAELPATGDIRLRIVPVATVGQAPRIAGSAAATSPAGALRLIREFDLAAGVYDVQAVVGQPRSGANTVVTLAKSRLTVPDVWGGDLAVTPLVIGQATGTARRDQVQPFNFGRTSLIPAVSGRFSQASVINVAFRIFNWTAKPEEKPDLTAEYFFYEQGARQLHLFNKVKPQILTEKTLGPDFTPTGGAVSTGMGVPLGAFTLGEFELKVVVTDNRSKRSTEGRTRFTVTP